MKAPSTYTSYRRAKRIGGAVGDYLVGRLAARGGHEVTVIDPRTHEGGFFMQLMEKAHFHYRKGEAVPPELATTAAVLRAADAYIVCTPEMNHTISPGAGYKRAVLPFLTGIDCHP
jgi:NAD(P)H-dependent FMN reductase